MNDAREVNITPQDVTEFEAAQKKDGTESALNSLLKRAVEGRGPFDRTTQSRIVDDSIINTNRDINDARDLADGKITGAEFDSRKASRAGGDTRTTEQKRADARKIDEKNKNR